MEEQRKTWTSEEAMGNLDTLTRLEWSKAELPEGVRELLETYEAAIPQLAAEIRNLREELREAKRGKSSPDADSGATMDPEGLAEFARRLGLDHR